MKKRRSRDRQSQLNLISLTDSRSQSRLFCVHAPSAIDFKTRNLPIQLRNYVFEQARNVNVDEFMPFSDILASYTVRLHIGRKPPGYNKADSHPV